MVTGELKNKIDAIRQMVWNSGISNPITVVEQITYLMFIHSLDENELHTEQEENLLRQFQPDMKPLKRIFPEGETGQSMRWSRFKTKTAKEIYRIISTLCFPAMKEIHDVMLPDFDANGELVPQYDKNHSEDSGDFTSDENLLAVTNTSKTELLFVALFLRMLKKGGRVLAGRQAVAGAGERHSRHYRAVPGKGNGNGRSRAALCRSRRLWTTGMICPSTSTRRWNIRRWSIRVHVKF